jgi:hypothetical protein
MGKANGARKPYPSQSDDNYLLCDQFIAVSGTDSLKCADLFLAHV